MDKKHLAIALSKLEPIDLPIASLEQYQTPGEAAAVILYIALPDIQDKVVADLGCGNGIFAIGAALLGAESVYGLDIDPAAINVAKRNAKNIGVRVNFVCRDVREFYRNVDTIIQNPPFGVQEEHADKMFLQKACELARVVYTIHKIESKVFIEKFSEDVGFKSKLIGTFDFPIKATMDYHKKPVHQVKVGLWKLTKT